jgi:hypothetical protein
VEASQILIVDWSYRIGGGGSEELTPAQEGLPGESLDVLI